MEHPQEEYCCPKLQNKDDFEKIYADCLEKQPPPSRNTRQNYMLAQDNLQREFEKYITLLQKDSFKFGYECGWRAAIKKDPGK